MLNDRIRKTREILYLMIPSILTELKVVKYCVKVDFKMHY